MDTSTERLGTRVVRSLREFLRFGIVGGSGVLVNLLVFYLTKKAIDAGFDLHEGDIFFNLFGTRFNIRWYHVLATVAFLVANTWNYQLNRAWTFRGPQRRSWIRGFFPFLATGVMAFVVSLVFLTLFMNPNSPIGLPDHIFDDSTGLRTKSYWSQGLATLIATPVNYIINKIWTFSKPKQAPKTSETS